MALQNIQLTRGLALMTVLSKALPLTASYIPPLSGFESHLGSVKKLPVTWCKAVGFDGYSGFLHQLQLAIHDSAAVWHKVT